MNPRQIELALRKQRLQMRSAALREAFAGHAGAWTPAFSLADRIRTGLFWLRRHPALPVAALTALLVARPRTVWRWVRRGFFAWQTLGRLRNVISGQ